MKKIILILQTLFEFYNSYSQSLSINFSINTSQERAAISPYIYGGNTIYNNITGCRQGGNRWTGYNWETNASSAGSDYNQSSDNYLVSSLPAADQNIPGIAVTKFVDQANSKGLYTLVTLQAAGYVAADKNGTVSASEVAPSPRWKEIKFTKSSALSLNPDVNDGYVYIDEQVNFLVKKCGSASTKTGIKAYSVDNEPCLWSETHPRIHPNKVGCAELINRTTEVANLVKELDPAAEIFGPALFGWSAYVNLHGAPDWNTYKNQYGRFINYYLDKMKTASATSGKRLLDVLDLHWYSEAQGQNNSGGWERVWTTNSTDPGIIQARVQSPRSLWDPSYTEHSWVAQNKGGPITLIPDLLASINNYYPGTKLAFTEFSSGGDNHISGAVAMADMMGIFGKYGVHSSFYWYNLNNYIGAAHAIYRNYDGNKSAYGDTKVKATTTDYTNSSIYSSVDANDSSKLHIIIINKSLDKAINSSIAITSKVSYNKGRVWMIDKSGPSVKETAAIAAINGNTFNYNVPAMSVCHFVLTAVSTGVTSMSFEQEKRLFYSNPYVSGSSINYDLDGIKEGMIRIYDTQGRVIKKYNHLSGQGTIEWSGVDNNSDISSGVYFIELASDKTILEREKMVLIR